MWNTNKKIKKQINRLNSLLILVEYGGKYNKFFERDLTHVEAVFTIMFIKKYVISNKEKKLGITLK